jgi:hypothetical protein
MVDTFHPKWLTADGFDEQMGMGRDSRTLGSNLTNGEILGQTINRVNTLLQHHSKNQTKMVIWADMVVHGARYSTEIYTRGCHCSHACSLEALASE